MMFNPSRNEVRRFFVEAWRKHRAGAILTPIEAQALPWIERHPEYHGLLERPDEAIDREFDAENGESNPFLHLSLHLALAEQLSIDQPPGIRAAFARLQARHASLHDAAHAAIECLAQTIWEAQRATAPVDPLELNARYLEALERAVGG